MPSWLATDRLLLPLVSRSGGFRLAREMDRNQKAICSFVGEFVAFPVVLFVLALPHAEAVVRLRRPVFQILHDDLAARIIPFGFFQNHFSLSVIHLGFGYAGLLVYFPSEALRVDIEFLPLER